MHSVEKTKRPIKHCESQYVWHIMNEHTNTITTLQYCLHKKNATSLSIQGIHCPYSKQVIEHLLGWVLIVIRNGRYFISVKGSLTLCHKSKKIRSANFEAVETNYHNWLQIWELITVISHKIIAQSNIHRFFNYSKTLKLISLVFDGFIHFLQFIKPLQVI